MDGDDQGAAREALRIALSQAAMSPTQLARRAGIGVATVTDFLNGARWPQLRSRALMEQALELTPGSLGDTAVMRTLPPSQDATPTDVGPTREGRSDDAATVKRGALTVGERDDVVQTIEQVAQMLMDLAQRLKDGER